MSLVGDGALYRETLPPCGPRVLTENITAPQLLWRVVKKQENNLSYIGVAALGY